MASTMIVNDGFDAISLPFPFTGLLGQGEGCIVDLGIAAVAAFLGPLVQTGGLKLTSLPNASGSTDFRGGAAVSTGTLLANGGIAIGGTLTAATVAANTFSGTTITGARELVGPFTVTTAASQTTQPMVWGVSGAGWVASRAGSLASLSLSISVDNAVNDILTVSVFKNGSLANANAKLVVLGGLSHLKASTAFTPGAFTFTTLDIITLVYTSTNVTWGNGVLVATLEVQS